MVALIGLAFLVVAWAGAISTVHGYGAAWTLVDCCVVMPVLAGITIFVVYSVCLGLWSTIRGDAHPVQNEARGKADPSLNPGITKSDLAARDKQLVQTLRDVQDDHHH